MIKKTTGLVVPTLLLAILGSIAMEEPAQAQRRMFARGANGVAGGYANQGQYGQRAGFRALGQNAGFGARASSYAGPNGGTFQSSGGGAYKKGVGAFRQGQWAGTGPNGGAGSGYSNNTYNAQTGQGTRNSGATYTNPQGQNYGYDGTTSYTKGQGATSTIETQNNGSYNVDWQKGEKPVVTPAASTP